MAETMDMEEIVERLAEYEGWEQEGPWLTKPFEFSDFEEAVEFVDEVAEVAEELGHHPRVMIHGYNQVVLSITSHEEGGITEKDFEFVDQVEELLDGF